MQQHVLTTLQTNTKELLCRHKINCYQATNDDDQITISMNTPGPNKILVVNVLSNSQCFSSAIPRNPRISHVTSSHLAWKFRGKMEKKESENT